MVNLGTVLQNSQLKAQGSLADFLSAFEKDHQWLEDVLTDASALFKKPIAEDEGDVKNDSERDDVEEPDETGPILLPQTPRVKNARAARMQTRKKRTSSIKLASKVRRSSVSRSPYKNSIVEFNLKVETSTPNKDLNTMEEEDVQNDTDVDMAVDPGQQNGAQSVARVEDEPPARTVRASRAFNSKTSVASESENAAIKPAPRMSKKTSKAFASKESLHSENEIENAAIKPAPRMSKKTSKAFASKESLHSENEIENAVVKSAVHLTEKASRSSVTEIAPDIVENEVAMSENAPRKTRALKASTSKEKIETPDAKPSRKRSSSLPPQTSSRSSLRCLDLALGKVVENLPQVEHIADFSSPGPPCKLSKIEAKPLSKPKPRFASSKTAADEARRPPITNSAQYRAAAFSGGVGSGSAHAKKARSRVVMEIKSPLVTNKPMPGSASKQPSNVLGIRSFMPAKAFPAKPSNEELQLKKEEELKSRQEKEELARRRKDEMTRAKAEENRLQREAREKKVLEARMAREEEKRVALELQKKELEEKLDTRNRVKETKKNQASAVKKAKREAEEKRMRGEVEMKKEEERRQKEEEEGRKRREEEEKMRRVELKKKQMEEEKRKQEEETKKKQILAEQMKRKQEQEIERKKKEEEERRKRELEEEEKRKQKEEKRKIQVEVYDQVKTENLNRTYDKMPEKKLNGTFTKEPTAECESYDMTPSRDEMPPQPLKDEENYDIGDLRSDEDTDDEDHPRKIVPVWAQGGIFRSTLLRQCFHPPDLDQIFYVMEASPDLSEIFVKKRLRFNKRTSSAVWDMAPTTHKW